MTMFTRNDKGVDQTGDTKMQDVKATDRPGTTQETAPIRSTSSAPAGSPRPSGGDAATSVISKALKITGQLESSEAIRIDGVVEGDVRGQSVLVGSGATITGTVSGESVELSGTVNGKIEARSVVLTQSARMSGDVIHQDIKIESGAFIDGSCRPSYGKNHDTNVHTLAATAASAQEAAKKPANGGASAKAGFGTL